MYESITCSLCIEAKLDRTSVLEIGLDFLLF